MKNGKYILGSSIILIQLFDIVIHVATDQVEPLRIISNVILMIWVGVILVELIKISRG